MGACFLYLSKGRIYAILQRDKPVMYVSLYQQGKGRWYGKFYSRDDYI